MWSKLRNFCLPCVSKTITIHTSMTSSSPINCSCTHYLHIYNLFSVITTTAIQLSAPSFLNCKCISRFKNVLVVAVNFNQMSANGIRINYLQLIFNHLVSIIYTYIFLWVSAQFLRKNDYFEVNDEIKYCLLRLVSLKYMCTKMFVI